MQWTPFHLDFERVITAIDGNRITVDAPIFNAIDARWGGGSVIPAEDVRISQVGIENLRAESAYDPDVTCLLQLQPYPCDEEHAVNLVRMDNVKDAWVRDVVARHFFHGVVELGRGSKHVTVQDAASLEPVSVLTGSRRYPFHILGQLNLVQRAYSEGARHAFAVSSRVPGPNVFLYSAPITILPTASRTIAGRSAGSTTTCARPSPSRTGSIWARATAGRVRTTWPGIRKAAWSRRSLLRRKTGPSAMWESGDRAPFSRGKTAGGNRTACM